MINRMMKAAVIIKDQALKGACVVLRAESIISDGHIIRCCKSPYF